MTKYFALIRVWTDGVISGLSEVPDFWLFSTNKMSFATAFMSVIHFENLEKWLVHKAVFGGTCVAST